jgi:hypothetical protein
VPEGKKERTVMSLLEKVAVLNKLEREMRIAVVACCDDVRGSTVFFFIRGMKTGSREVGR